MICSPEKNDTTMHDERLANQKSSFRVGGVIFYLVAYLSGPPSVPQYAEIVLRKYNLKFTPSLSIEDNIRGNVECTNNSFTLFTISCI